MKRLFIIRLGEPHEAVARKLGYFEDWIARDLGQSAATVDPRTGAPLPRAEDLAGVVVTGSNAMVTDRADWSERTADWLADLVGRAVPVLGICYGHQLLARALGGEVIDHPGGRELGTVPVQRLEAAADDALFAGMPSRFGVNVVHSQTVRTLPPDAVRLAANDFEPNHAFRVGCCAWGLQFHPEFRADAMRAYVDALAPQLVAEGGDPQALAAQVRETPESRSLLTRFARIAGSRDAGI
ncbi:MAG: glutamine amidotransferase [Halothiobacillaceae bacterium]